MNWRVLYRRIDEEGNVDLPQLLVVLTVTITVLLLLANACRVLVSIIVLRRRSILRRPKPNGRYDQILRIVEPAKYGPTWGFGDTGHYVIDYTKTE